MEKKKTGVIIANVLGMILLVAVAMLNVWYSVQEQDIHLKVTGVLTVLAIVSACIYFAYGARKKAASYYKGFLIMFAISEFIRIAYEGARPKMPTDMPADMPAEIAGEMPPAAIGEMSTPRVMNSTEILISLIIGILIFAMLFVLAFATNLGKRTSLIIGGFVLALGVAEMLRNIIGVLSIGGDVVQETVVSGARALLAVALLLMILGKYKDKAKRNTK